MWPQIFIAAAVSVAAAGCQPSLENRLLAPSGMSLEDPKFLPSDEYLRMGKVHFRNGDYGQSELNFRKAVEVTPNDTEAWLGLAASYDQLRRFDLADRAYEKVLAFADRDPIVLNNAGYSQLLRGNTEGARRMLLKAYELDPVNPIIANNLKLLGESGKAIKRAS
jgi:Flp pilus assembly protein TadD